MVDNDVVMLQVNQQRLHSRTKPRGQDEKGAVAAEERQGDDQGRQADRKTDGRRGRVGETEGSYEAGTSDLQEGV